MVHLRITAFELMFLSWVCSSENEAVGALNGPLWGLPPLVGLMRTWLNLLMTLSHLFPAWSSLFSLGESSEGFWDVQEVGTHSFCSANQWDGDSPHQGQRLVMSIRIWCQKCFFIHIQLLDVTGSRDSAGTVHRWARALITCVSLAPSRTQGENPDDPESRPRGSLSMFRDGERMSWRQDHMALEPPHHL